MTLKIFDIIKQLIQALKQIKLDNHFHNDIGTHVYLNKQWFDCRQANQQPELSLFILEETPLDSKGNCFKQELTIHVEGLTQKNNSDEIYLLAADIKKALLNPKLPFSIAYHGYEINLPEDGASVARVHVKFKVIYLEKIS